MEAGHSDAPNNPPLRTTGQPTCESNHRHRRFAVTSTRWDARCVLQCNSSVSSLTRTYQLNHDHRIQALRW
eukprot:814017-Prorocentrum_minimum.AAC.1